MEKGTTEVKLHCYAAFKRRMAGRAAATRIPLMHIERTTRPFPCLPGTHRYPHQTPAKDGRSETSLPCNSALLNYCRALFRGLEYHAVQLEKRYVVSSTA